MATNTLLDTRTASLGELLSNGKSYKVPPFQRDYSWNEENWEDLWNDIIGMHGQEDRHYMGAIVLQGNREDDSFTIIDGQQRLATLSIIAIAIIDKIDRLVSDDIEPEANRERRDILKRTYLGDKDPGSLNYSSKLLLNENNDDFYQGNLINLREPRALRSLSKSNQLLWKAFSYFSDEIENLRNEESSRLRDILIDGAHLSGFLTNTVAQKLLFIQISVEDQINAYVVFETLNSRGVELGATDLLKNYLFSRFKSEDDFNAAQRKWRNITRTVGMEKFPEFLRYFLSMTHRRVRKNKLFKLARESFKTPEQAFELLDQLEGLSELYVALSNPYDDFWLDHPNYMEIRELIRSLNLFGTKQAYPALFAAHQSFDDNKFQKLLEIISIISFRYTVIGDLNPNELESQYNSLAMNIADGTIKSPLAAFNAIKKELYVIDDKFRQDFASISIPTKQTRKKNLVKYILRQLEKHQSGKDAAEDSFTVEHILPQEPVESWQQNFQAGDIDEMIYRLGNMTPLERSKNKTVSRDPYEDKQREYQTSAYTITRDIQAEEWNVGSIVNRQERMAKQATQIWSIDY